MSEHDDDASGLVERFERGESDAVAEMCERLRGRLQTYVREKIGSRLNARVDADDVVQQALANIYFQLKTGDREIQDLFAYARGVARHIISSYARRRSVNFEKLARATESSSDFAAGNEPATTRSVTPEALATRAENRRLVREAIAALRPEVANIVSLRLLRQLPFKEIAALVGKSPEATEKAYLRAKASIRKYLERRMQNDRD